MKLIYIYIYILVACKGENEVQHSENITISINIALVTGQVPFFKYQCSFFFVNFLFYTRIRVPHFNLCQAIPKNTLIRYYIQKGINK
eukprot:gene8065-5617_t